MRKLPVDRSKRHYKVCTFYKKTDRFFSTKEEALNAIRAHGLATTTPHYTELWFMLNADNGSELHLLCDSKLELTYKLLKDGVFTKNG